MTQLSANAILDLIEGPGDIFKAPSWAAPLSPTLEIKGEEHLLLGDGTGPFLPIEWFKERHRFAIKTAPIGEGEAGSIYRSSGTTGGGHSLSQFSQQGLDFYQRAAVRTFRAVLSDFHQNPEIFSIVSLIPPLAEAPHSSLAAMLDFFSRRWPLLYSTPEHCPEIVRDLKGPICLFGTTAHHLALATTQTQELPQGSIAVETGGLKTMGKSLDRVSLHEMIGKTWNLAPSHIVSEYGMAELASQAYDWQRPGQRAARQFRYPRWVKFWAMRGLGIQEKPGKGALLVRDLARLDIPWAIRTQDFVEVTPTGFRYCGRVPQAVLKGCALGVSDL